MVGILADEKIPYFYGVATLMIMIYSTGFLLVDFISTIIPGTRFLKRTQFIRLPVSVVLLVFQPIPLYAR